MLSDALRAQISGLITEHPVVLFMKGTRRGPQCGFSGQVVQILDELLPEYETVNVLSSAELRDGVKAFSEWPTIPQLFINGEFVGGCDIVRSLRESGELERLLGASAKPAVAAAPVEAPVIHVSPAALAAFRGALEEDATGEVLHLKIDAEFQNDLYFAAPEANAVAVRSGELVLHLDRASAGRADGLRIDFIGGANAGFKIDNPNQPPSVKQLLPAEAKERIERGELELFDVRPEFERQIASVAAARPLDDAGQEFLLSLDRARPIAFLCHHGMRSQSAAEQVLREGFRNVHNVKGGIHAWAETVDPSLARY